jgi:hypothetical protein
MNEQLSNVLVQLAQKLSTTTEHLWGVIITQAKIDGIMFSIASVVLLVFLYGMYKLGKKAALCEGYNDDLLWIPVTVGTLAGSFLFLLCVSKALTAILNPEYYALHEVLSALTK